MHHVSPAEFVPALPALGGAAEMALSLFTLVLWGVALGLAIAWRYTLGAALEWAANVMDKVSIPLGFTTVRPLHPFASQLRAIDYAITAGLSKVLVGAEHATVWLFHHGLNLIVWTAREIWALSRDTLRTFEHVNNVWIPGHVRQALAHTGGFATWLLHEARREGQAFRDWTTALVHREAAAWRTGIHVVHQSIAATLPRVGRLERDATRQSVRLRRLEELVTLGGFSAFMWRWLSKYELKWLRCGSVGRIGSTIGCGGFGLLEDLLAASFLALAVSDICDTMVAVTKLAEWFRPLLMKLVDVEDQLIGCGATRRDPLGFTKPELLDLPPLYLPAVANPLPLSFT